MHRSSVAIVTAILTLTILSCLPAFAQAEYQWELKSPAQTVGNRQAYVTAWDSVNQVVMLFGGRTTTSGADSNDLWAYDGEAWTEITPSTSPPARVTAGMAFDGDEGVAVLFGGASGAFRNDTWEYDAGSGVWTETSPAVSPSALSGMGMGMVYDSQRQKILLYGGHLGGGQDSGSTWEYDVATDTWTQRFPVHSPPPRSYFAMAWDSDRHVAVLFGGYSYAQGIALNETWEWNGSDWSQVGTTTAPAP